MIRFLLGTTGLIAGMVTALALVLFNPLVTSETGQTFNFDPNLVKDYDATDFKGVDLSLESFLGYQKYLGRNDAFAEPGIENTRISMMILEADGTSHAALAIKLSYLDADNSILHGQLNVNTHWNIIWPGQGSYILTARENYWQLLRDQLVSFYRPPRDHYVVTTSADGFLIGGAGRFSNVAGAYEEIVAFDKAGQQQLLGSLEMKVGKN